MSILDAETLHSSILRERSCGLATVDVQPKSAHSVDSYVSTFGFKPLGADWRSIDRQTALQVLHRVLERDLAYDVPLIEPARAHVLAESFLSLFSASAQFCTNGSMESGGLGWSPITESTFDHGVIAHDDHSIGIIWVQDED